jgi:predicted nucleic acid-binding protein
MGLTLDTGALIALDRRKFRILTLLQAAASDQHSVTVPAVVLAEWWRAPSRAADRLLAAFVVEPLTEDLAKLAGEALGRVGRGPSVVDAIVMASAAQRGDVVLTSDIEDLVALQTAFPNVRVLGV